MPEIEQIQETIAPNLSREESTKKLAEILDKKYPSIIENRKRFELAPIHDAIIKTLEDSN